jgi:hypothetical protein
MKRLILLLALLPLLAAAGFADPITLSATGGVGTGKDVYTVSGLTFGNSLTFEYQFVSVTWAGPGFPFLNVNGKALSNPFPDYNDYQNAPTGLLPGSIDTSSLFGQVGDLAFTADTFNTVGNAVTILIQNVKVDGDLVALSSTPTAPVPEPCTLLLMGPALGGLIARRRKRLAR